MYVVTWESKCGTAGHQAATSLARAERVANVLSRALPAARIEVLHADAFSAQAVAPYQRQAASGRARPSNRERRHARRRAG